MHIKVIHALRKKDGLNEPLFLSWSPLLVSVQQLLLPVYMGIHKLTRSTRIITGELIKTCFLTLQETVLQQKNVSSVALFLVEKM